MQERALEYLDGNWVETFNNYLRDHDDLSGFNYGVNYWHYQYARSFTESQNGNSVLGDGFEYAFAKAEKSNASQPLYQRLLIALTLDRYGKQELAKEILEGVKQGAVNSAEKGMFWKENQNGYSWYASDIETQALAIEAFAEITGDIQTVEELKTWLLYKKRSTAGNQPKRQHSPPMRCY